VRPRSAATFLTSIILVSCADGIVVPGLADEEQEPIEALISDPVTLTPAAVGVTAAPGTDVIYVSLPPGSLSAGAEAVVTNLSSGANEEVSIVNGGFDPVPIAASAGESLRFSIYADLLGDGDLGRRLIREWTDVVPPRRPPIVVRTYPPRGKRDVPVSLTVLVVVSEPVDTASLGPGTVELLADGAPVATDVNVSSNGLNLVLTPHGPLAPNEEHVLRIAGSVSDLDGDTLGEDIEVRFTTGPGGPPIVLAPADSCRNHPSTATPTFADANLEGEVRSELGFGAQDVLTCELVEGLASLTVHGAPYSVFTGPAPATAIRSLVGIQNLTGLTRLVVTNHALTDIGPISSLTQLDTLWLGVANYAPPTISDLEPLRSLTRLRFLLLNNTRAIRDLGPLSGLSQLNELHIRFNIIEDIGPLAGLRALRRINLAGNLIRSVEPLRGLTGLELLSINHNEISDLSPVAGLTNVRGTLWLYYNELTDLRSIRGMTGVTRLIAASNNVTSVSGVETLTSAHFLFLNDNPNLTNVEALFARPDLARDTIELGNTSVSCADVQRLQQLGAVVRHTCGLPPVLLPRRALAPATVGVPYTEVLMATGGDGVYTWSQGAAPGLTFSPSGVISGVPTFAIPWRLEVAVRSGNRSAGRVFTIVASEP
jgi:hypothetical protein